jgi:hypothetical protein
LAHGWRHRAVAMTTSVDDLFTEELGYLLAAFGNNEAKGLLLAAMQPGHIYSSGDLRRLMHECQGQLLAWRLHPSLAFDYCAHALAPIGLVTQEVLDPDLRTSGYMKTPYGQEKGEALAGHLLQFSESCAAFSLAQLFGSTNTVQRVADTRQTAPLGRRRTSFRRYRLVLAIATVLLPLRETDLARLLQDTPEKLGPHLHILSRSGIISYRTKQLGDPYVTYRLVSGAPSTLAVLDRRAASLSGQLFAMLHAGPTEPTTSEALLEHLIGAYPARAAQDRRALRQTVSRTLSYLERIGVVERGPFRPAVQSEIDLTREQRTVLAPLVAIIERFTAGDPQFLAEGRRAAQHIVRDPERFRRLLDKAHAASWNANRHTVEELAQLVLAILAQRPNASLSSIHAAMVEQYGVQVTQARIKQVVRALKDSGAVVLSDAGRPYRYSLGM